MNIDTTKIVTAAQKAALAVPKPIEAIRAIEASNDDDRKKLTRQFMLAVMLKEAMALAPLLTKDQVHAHLMSQASGSGNGYAKLYEEEQAIIPWRKLIP